jgi:hypothetical protein
MRTTKARLTYAARVPLDIEICRRFLRRRGGKPRERVREILNAARFLREHPKMHPVAGTSRIGLPLRRRNAGQFVVVYSYFEPSPSEPCGLVSVRAIRHTSQEDVLFGVEERRAYDERTRPSFLILR